AAIVRCTRRTGFRSRGLVAPTTRAPGQSGSSAEEQGALAADASAPAGSGRRSEVCAATLGAWAAARHRKRVELSRQAAGQLRFGLAVRGPPRLLLGPAARILRSAEEPLPAIGQPRDAIGPVPAGGLHPRPSV